MRLSTRARYALRMMLDIAKNGAAGNPVSLADVAERTDLSKGYLEQLAANLRSHQLIRGVAGNKGGYRLTRPPEAISLREIIEAAIGKVSILECLEEPSTCMRTDVCECRMVYALINYKITQVLDEFSLADLQNPRLRVEVQRQLDGFPREERH